MNTLQLTLNMFSFLIMNIFHRKIPSMNSQSRNSNNPIHCSFVLLSCNYSTDPNYHHQFKFPAEASEIAITYADNSSSPQKLTLSKYMKNSLTNDNSQEDQKISDHIVYRQNSIPTKKIAQSHTFEIGGLSCETFKKEHRNKKSLKQKSRNSSSLCDIVSKIQEQNKSLAIKEEIPRLNMIRDFKKKKQKIDHGQRIDCMSQQEFKIYYQAQMNKSKLEDSVYANQKRQKQNKKFPLNPGERQYYFQEENTQQTFKIIDNQISFTKISAEEQEKALKLNQYTSIEPYHQKKGKSIVSSQRRRERQQTYTEQPTKLNDSMIQIQYHSNKQNSFISRRAENQSSNLFSLSIPHYQMENFQTLANISKNVESCKDISQSEDNSLLMSYHESASSRITESDGSKLYRTIKHLTSKNITQISR